MNMMEFAEQEFAELGWNTDPEKQPLVERLKEIIKVVEENIPTQIAVKNVWVYVMNLINADDPIEDTRREYQKLGYIVLDDDGNVVKPSDDQPLEKIRAYMIFKVLSEVAKDKSLDLHQLCRFGYKLTGGIKITPLHDNLDDWVDINETLQYHKYYRLLFKDTITQRTYTSGGVIFVGVNDEVFSGTSDSCLYVNLPITADEIETHMIQIDENGRCVSEEVFQQYMELVPRMVHPLISERKPVSML